jgi:hypothetical protein
VTTDPEVEAAKARDSRFSRVALGLAIEGELRDSPTLKLLLSAVKTDASDALRTLADVSPTDLNAVSKVVVRAQTLVYIGDVLDTILKRTRADIAELHAEDRASEYERDD